MPIYAFVTEISESPTILLDLDNQSPFSVVEGTKTSPPVRRTNSVGSVSRDGDTIAAKSYGDRVITIELWPEPGTSAEEQGEGIQAINRLLDGPQWLMWQHDAKIEPVFYRTKYGDVEIEDEFADEKPSRNIALTLVAEPFSYGLEVTGTATLNGSGGLGASPSQRTMLPPIQGDVPAALVASVSGEAVPSRWVVAASAGPDAALSVRLSESVGLTASAHWSVATVSDPFTLSGSFQRFTHSAGGSDTVATIFTGMLPMLGGDYRVFVRMAVATDGFSGDKTSGIFPAAVGPSGTDGAVPVYVDRPSWSWVDLGVGRYPDGSVPHEVGFEDAVAVARRAYFSLFMAAGVTGTIDIDAVLFVPAGLDGAVFSSVALLDPNDSAFRFNGRTGRLTTLEGDLSGPYEGGLPSVVPGTENALVVFRDDDLIGDVTVDWSYYPRYLYDRPASS